MTSGRISTLLVSVLLAAGCNRHSDADASSANAANQTGTNASDATPGDIKPGIYGDVAYSEESGDLAGVELEIMPGPGNRVEVTLCEGWCNSVVKTTYRVTPTGIAFSYREQQVDPETGRSLPGETFSYDLRPDGKDILLKGSWFAPERARLKRLTKRYGLDVAVESENEAKNAADRDGNAALAR